MNSKLVFNINYIIKYAILTSLFGDGIIMIANSHMYKTDACIKLRPARQSYITIILFRLHLH